MEWNIETKSNNEINNNKKDNRERRIRTTDPWRSASDTVSWTIGPLCVYSNSRNDVPRVLQRYGTIAAHTWRRASVLVVFVVFLRAHARFCRFDKADATADVQWHCNHWPPLWYHYFPAQSSLGADILVYWIGKIVRTCAAGGSGTLNFLRGWQTPYPLGQALRYTRCKGTILLPHKSKPSRTCKKLKYDIFPRLVGIKVY